MQTSKYSKAMWQRASVTAFPELLRSVHYEDFRLVGPFVYYSLSRHTLQNGLVGRSWNVARILDQLISSEPNRTAFRRYAFRHLSVTSQSQITKLIHAPFALSFGFFVLRENPFRRPFFGHLVPTRPAKFCKKCCAVLTDNCVNCIGDERTVANKRKIST